MAKFFRRFTVPLALLNAEIVLAADEGKLSVLSDILKVIREFIKNDVAPTIGIVAGIFAIAFVIKRSFSIAVIALFVSATSFGFDVFIKMIEAIVGKATG